MASRTEDPSGRRCRAGGLLKGAGGVAFGVGSVAALKLPFFAVDGAQLDPASCVGTDISATDKKLIVSNWPAYIDPTQEATSTLPVFEQQTGITVDYTDDVNDNSEFYAKVKNQLGACQPIKPRHDGADRLDGRPDDRPGLDPEAGRRARSPTCTPT